ncbi:hypothetical protein CHLRE_13g592500v5 [Chlamydomonas reinhardtii]|uniref:Bifunctional cytosolic FAD synthase/FAD diphosphatase n=1 Tax=Chlamydomonas reinhardtii TaxID=3055 RepID=FAD1_CHLRE|nr:uncharacterized protein CHLRE_13g592500v5 [Chlamydomonas reinhardtii]PNW74277.1 hypothetical protein CHLRE_13g592500v5 [Chlamydomonas reinhardtii]
MADILDSLESIPDPVVLEKSKKAIACLRRTCALYPLEKIAFSFNGGKDSTVLLHLLRAAVAQQEAAKGSAGTITGLGGMLSFYFRQKDDFAEVKAFVEGADKAYGLDVEYLSEQDFKKGLCEYLERTGVMAIVLGTRRGDPNAGGQDVFCPSSEGWPAFMRVNPILDWTYHDVWVFLRATRVAYCSLYDHGYTSLGGVGNTLPNNTLRRPDGSYEPAYHLADGRLERVGRVHAAPAKAPAAAMVQAAHDAHAAQPQPGQAAGSGGSAGGAASACGASQGGVAVPVHHDSGEVGAVQANGEAPAAAPAPAPAPARSGGGAPEAVSELTRSAAIVVVGDELLSGKVDDVNARFLCRELRSLGWQVLRVVFVPDAVDDIASVVRALAATAEVVITAGGIGPTLDDVTMQGIALAVGQPLVRLPGMVERMASYFGGEAVLTPAHLKMAEGPQHADLIDYKLADGNASKFPILKINNIYVLPGVPSLLVQKWGALKERLRDDALAPFRNATLRLSLTDETTIAPALERVASTHGLDVAVGSYPVDNGIIVTLDSKNTRALQAAVADITELLPGEAVVALERDVDSLQ